MKERERDRIEGMTDEGNRNRLVSRRKIIIIIIIK